MSFCNFKENYFRFTYTCMYSICLTVRRSNVAWKCIKLIIRHGTQWSNKISLAKLFSGNTAPVHVVISYLFMKKIQSINAWSMICRFCLNGEEDRVRKVYAVAIILATCRHLFFNESSLYQTHDYIKQFTEIWFWSTGRQIKRNKTCMFFVILFCIKLSTKKA